MKRIIFFTVILFNCLSQAQSKPEVTDPCLEKASNAVIRHLERLDYAANLHLVKDAGGRVSGLTDRNDVFLDYDLVSIESSVPNQVTVLFNSYSELVYVDVQIVGKKTAQTCRILKVESGKDDLD